MPKFSIIKPVAITVGEGKNAAVKHFRHPGVEVELTDEVAAPLLTEGRIEAVKEPEKRRPRPVEGGSDS